MNGGGGGALEVLRKGFNSLGRSLGSRFLSGTLPFLFLGSLIKSQYSKPHKVGNRIKAK